MPLGRIWRVYQWHFCFITTVRGQGIR